jgi:Zn-dependent peptidase ImmA (M78 family)
MQTQSTHDRAERVAEHFAACLLMPRMWLKRDWGRGLQDVTALARRYKVSTTAMRIRLEQIGLVNPQPRCGGVLYGDDWL